MNKIAKIESYILKAPNGRKIRTATKVVFENGSEVKFIEKMTKKEAIKNAQYQNREKH